MVQVNDTLTTPMETNLNATMRITALDSMGSVPKFGSSEKDITDGEFKFNLVEGRFQLSIRYTDTFEDVGILTVTESTPDPAVLQDILNIPVEPPEPVE
jgi:hypothetical protein